MTQDANRLYADSTVAMSIYNVLCMSGALSLGNLHETVERMQHINLQPEQTKRAVDGLLERGRLREVDGKYDLVAQHRLVIVRRDLSDYDYQTMGGGWEGWQARDPRVRDGVGFRPLEQLLGLPETGRRPKPLPPPPPTVEVQE